MLTTPPSELIVPTTPPGLQSVTLPYPTPAPSNAFVNPLTNKTVPFRNLRSGTSLAHPPPLPTFLNGEFLNATSPNGTHSSNATITSFIDTNLNTSVPSYNITFSSWDNSTLSSTSSIPVGFGSFDNASPTQDAIVVYGPGGGHLTNFGITLITSLILALIALFTGVTVYFRHKRRKKHRPDPNSRNPLSTSGVDFPRSSYDPGAFAGVGGDDLTITPDESESPSFSPPSTLSLVRQKISLTGLLPAVLGPPSSLRKPTPVWPLERAEIAPPPLSYGPVTSAHGSSAHASSAHVSSTFGTIANGFEGSNHSTSAITSQAPSASDIVFTNQKLLSPCPPPASPVPESLEGRLSERRLSEEREFVVAVDYEGAAGGYHVW